jgi:FkbM family methyltransferase
MSQFTEKCRKTFVYPGKLLATFSIRECARFLIAYFRNQELLEIRSKNFPWPFWLRPRGTDIRVAYEIFTNAELSMEWPLPHPPRTIIDGGANVGYATMALKERWPESSIIAVEPDAANFAILKRNCSSLSEIKLVQKGIWGASCRLRVRPGSTKEAWALQFEPVFGESCEGILAESIPTLLAQIPGGHCDLLKLDIEGAEISIFQQTDLCWINNVSVILLETHGEAARDAVQAVARKFALKSRKVGEKLMLWH